MPTFDEPQSRNEAILQNMLGAENELPEPQSRIEELLQEILEQGSGGVTPAEIVAATGDMTAQQAADTLGNLGGEPEKLIVNVTQNGGVYSADKTFAEIEAAIAAGKTVECNHGEQVFHMNYYEEDESVCFDFIAIPNDLIETIIYIFSDNSCNKSEYRYQKKATIVTDISSTNITLSSAADNTIYDYGELTSLTVTAIANPGDFIIRFTSGATATTTNFPATMKFPEAFSAEANMRYEINVSNGYALAVGWPTS